MIPAVLISCGVFPEPDGIVVAGRFVVVVVRFVVVVVRFVVVTVVFMVEDGAKGFFVVKTAVVEGSVVVAIVLSACVVPVCSAAASVDGAVVPAVAPIRFAVGAVLSFAPHPFIHRNTTAAAQPQSTRFFIFLPHVLRFHLI